MGRLLLCDVCGPVGDLLQKLSGEEGNKWLEYLNKMLRKENPFDPAKKELPSILNWQAVGKALGMEKEFKELIDGFDSAPHGQWAIYMPKDLTCNKVWKALKERCDGYSWYGDDLDKKVSKRNDRDPANGEYAATVRAVVEADEENAGKSADQLDAEKHHGMTLLEREILELAYFLTTGEHLDRESWTMCPASQGVDGLVPCMRFNPGYCKVQIDRGDPGRSSSRVRSRSVSILPAKSR